MYKALCGYGNSLTGKFRGFWVVRRGRFKKEGTIADKTLTDALRTLQACSKTWKRCSL